MKNNRDVIVKRPAIFMNTCGIVLLCLGGCSQVTSGPREAQVTPLVTRDLPEFAGKEGALIMVEYPPGSQDPIHRHHAHAFVYVLEGSIVMQVKGKPEVTLTPGQTFYEGPDDLHVVGRNASLTKPAKFVVFLVKEKDAPILTREPVTEDQPQDNPRIRNTAGQSG